jgi:hypothetical protein
MLLESVRVVGLAGRELHLYLSIINENIYQHTTAST